MNKKDICKCLLFKIKIMWQPNLNTDKKICKSLCYEIKL